uniref:Complex 1 LYR protein domain-containing protein n=1 Tax=Globodera rostochiensis TaxID=31243 RepID=A0A914I8J8_GLORO
MSVVGVQQRLRSEVVQLYKTLYHMGKDYPQGARWFHERLKNAFARNAHVHDEAKVRELIKRGEYVVKELEALYLLRKYRAMKSRYYSD